MTDKLHYCAPGECRKFATWPPKDEMTSTFIYLRGEGEWPFTEAGHVIHRKDLSDLSEPYLLAVKAARSPARAELAEAEFYLAQRDK